MSQLAAHDPHVLAARRVRPDIECWARANEFLIELIGSPPDDLLWDDTHHLQGHGHLHGRELIVIAPRDDDHQTVVLTSEDWDAIRRASTDQRRELLTACAIADRNRLVAVLSDEGNDHALPGIEKRWARHVRLLPAKVACSGFAFQA